jgi:hypothetical protein
MSTVFSHTRAEPAQAIPAVPVPLDDLSTVGRRYPGDVGRLAALFRAHLHRCVGYIDCNMVPAAVVKHPAEWPHSGYLAIQQPPERYRVVDLLALSELCGLADTKEFQKVAS